MPEQRKAIETYKMIQSEIKGYEVGNDCALFWIDRFAKQYRKLWMEING